MHGPYVAAAPGRFGEGAGRRCTMSLSDAHPMSTPATIEQRFLAAAHAAEVDSARIAEVLSIAEEALGGTDTEVGCRALMSGAYLLADNGKCAAAMGLLDRAERIAARARLPIAHEAEYGRGHVLYQQGEWYASFSCFSTLLLSARFRHLRLGVRRNVLSHLALLCHHAQADDAALHCLDLAEYEMGVNGAAMAGPDRLNRARIEFSCWVSNAPAFASLRLFGGESNLPEASRRELLGNVEAQCAAIVQEHPACTPMLRHEAASHRLLVAALRQRDVGPVRQALHAFLELRMNNDQFEFDNWSRLLAAFLLLEADADAQDLVQRAASCRPVFPPLGVSELSVLTWRYLLSQLAQRQGDYRRALETYRDFANGATRQLGRINDARRELMTALTLRAGARPQHLPNRRPAYYEHARSAIREQPMLALTEVAQRVGVSERTLREAFRVYGGTSPKAYQTEVRLDAVRRLVDSGAARGMNTEAIAVAHGFGHASRLAAAFKRRFGLTLAACRADA